MKAILVIVLCSTMSVGCTEEVKSARALSSQAAQQCLKLGGIPLFEDKFGGVGLISDCKFQEKR